MEACDDIKAARTHLRQAARALEDRVLGREVTSHLRQAAKSMLKAGIAAIDERERGTAGDSAK
jgi:hypothetical protein